MGHARERRAADQLPESNDLTPNLVHGGHTLLFSSNGAGGLGSMDIWMSTRLPGCP